MSRIRPARALLITAIAAVAIICASTANAAGPVKQGGDPKDPIGPFPAEALPTAAETVGRALGNWIHDHRDDPGAGGVRVLEDRKTVLVYWKGAVPPGLHQLAASQAVPVTFKPAAYSRAELTAASIAVMDNNPGVVSAAGSEPDYSGISVVVSAKAPANAFAQVKATSTVPITLRWIGDPTPLDGRGSTDSRAATANGCPSPARCGDSAPFYGGGLMRIQGVSNSACSTGASLYAGAYNYMSTAWHCSADGSGTWVGYDSGNVIGTVQDSTHIKANNDFMIVGTASNYGRIWFGDWKTTSSIRVGGVEHPEAAITGPVVCSCGASGNGHYQNIKREDEFWTVRGRRVGPGFYVEEYPDRAEAGLPYSDLYPATGWVQTSDSGSPIVRGSSYYLVDGFLSAGGRGQSPYCAPGRHPGFDGWQGVCFTEYWASYADTDIDTFNGTLHIKTS